jgi:hypothetical protein
MNNFMVPSAPEFYVTKHGFLPWFRIRGAPFPYSHLPPPNINEPKIEVTNAIKRQGQSIHHADYNLFVEKVNSSLSPNDTSDSDQYSKIDRESECEQLLKKVMAKKSHQWNINMVKDKNDGTLMEKISQENLPRGGRIMECHYGTPHITSPEVFWKNLEQYNQHINASSANSGEKFRCDVVQKYDARFWEKEEIKQKPENEEFETNVVPNLVYLFMTFASFLYYFIPQFFPLILAAISLMTTFVKKFSKIKASFRAINEIWNLEEPSVKNFSGLKISKNCRNHCRKDLLFKPGDDLIYLGKVKKAVSAQDMLPLAESERFFVNKIVNTPQKQSSLEKSDGIPFPYEPIIKPVKEKFISEPAQKCKIVSKDILCKKKKNSCLNIKHSKQCQNRNVKLKSFWSQKLAFIDQSAPFLCSFRFIRRWHTKFKNNKAWISSSIKKLIPMLKLQKLFI